jgi:hypothetical protein
MHFTDRLTLDGALRRTADGFALVSARVARGGNVQLYLGSEIGIADKEIVRVYRPETEVFKRAALKSYSGVPITIGHPKDGVSAANWKDLAVGEVGEEVLRDGEFVRVPMMLRDANAISAVDKGTRELSMGYDAEITIADGVTPSGQKFDAVMGGFKMNHVAIVGDARGGPELRIGDGAKWGASPIENKQIEDEQPKDKTMTLKTITLDGLPVETTDAGAMAIEKLQRQLADATTSRVTAETKTVADAAAHTAALAAKDVEIATLKTQLADAKITPAKLRDAAKDYANTLAAAKIIAPAVVITDAMDTPAIYKAVVTAKMGDTAKDWSEANFETSFRTLAAGLPKGAITDGGDSLRSAFTDGLVTNFADARAKADAAREKHLNDLRNGYKPATA